MLDNLLKIDFIRFCLVGAGGFLINFGLLTLFYRLFGWPIFLAQLLAGEIALFNNFVLHQRWTYKRHSVTKSIAHLLWQFHLTSWVAIIGSALMVSVGVKSFKLNYLVALIISSAIALSWNFVWTKFVIWKHQQESQHEKSQ